MTPRVILAAVDLLPEPDDELNEASKHEIKIGAAELVRRWKLEDSRDRWKHTGEVPPKASEATEARTQFYRTPQSTIDAFFYVAGLGDTDYLLRWLAEHPLDAPHLRKIWRGKCSRMTR
jgi:hypothetical protein